MPIYTFTHDFAEVFAPLSYGPDAVVTRAIPAVDAAGAPIPDDPGATVVLCPGDQITLTTPLDHAHLVMIAAPASTPTPTGQKD